MSSYCPHKNDHWRTERTKKNLEELYEGRYTNFNYNKDTSLWEFNCNNCSSDEFVKAGLCSGIFSASASRLGNEKFPSCRCGECTVLTPDQNLYRCVKSAKDGYEITGYEEPYKGVYTLIGFICPKGNKNIATVVSFLTGRRCSCCAGSGFSKTKDGIIYLVKWKHISGISFLKYGITNRSLDERIKEQNRESSEGFSYEVLKVISGSGEDVHNLEQTIKKEVGGHYASPYIFPDGWTETFSVSKESLALSLMTLP